MAFRFRVVLDNGAGLDQGRDPYDAGDADKLQGVLLNTVMAADHEHEIRLTAIAADICIDLRVRGGRLDQRQDVGRSRDRLVLWAQGEPRHIEAEHILAGREALDDVIPAQKAEDVDVTVAQQKAVAAGCAGARRRIKTIAHACDRAVCVLGDKDLLHRTAFGVAVLAPTLADCVACDRAWTKQVEIRRRSD